MSCSWRRCLVLGNDYLIASGCHPRLQERFTKVLTTRTMSVRGGCFPRWMMVHHHASLPPPPQSNKELRSAMGLGGFQLGDVRTCMWHLLPSIRRSAASLSPTLRTPHLITRGCICDEAIFCFVILCGWKSLSPFF